MSHSVRTIPATDDLLAHLALSLRADCSGVLALHRSVVLLPTHRSAMAFRSVMAKYEGAAIMPRLIALGDIDAVFLCEQAVAAGADWVESLGAIARAIPDDQRRLALAKQLHAQPRLFDTPQTFEQCAQAARQLLGALDQLEAEQVPLEQLHWLSRQSLSHHWQKRLQLMRVAADWWQGYMARHGVVSMSGRNAQQVLWLAKCWSQSVPDFPVIVAGSTGSQSATRALMRAVSALPGGQVWLPVVDAGLLGEEAVAHSATHPLYSVQQTLNTLEVPYTPPDEPTDNHARRIDCRDEYEEAELIAALMREGLQQPGAKVALVSPDDTLIRHVDAALARYGIIANHAVGRSALRMPYIQWFLLLIEAAQSGFSSVAWLALMKHRLTGHGNGWDAMVDRVERELFRGLVADEAVFDRLQRVAADEPLLQPLCEAMQPLVALMQQTHVSASALGDTQRKAARMIAPEPDEVAEVIDAAQAALRLCGEIDPAQYASLLRDLLGEHKWFAHEDAHARAHILSPIEARLLRFDRVILAGLNEGTWPRAIAQDGWLHPQMREQLGMMPVELSIGLSAHDFCSLLCSAREVFMTRAARVEGAQTLPSRFVERLAAAHTVLPAGHEYLSWLRERPAREAITTMPPQASPPIEARPVNISVSGVEQWVRDPYGFYAKYILALRALEPIDRSADAALRGQIIHRVMERFVLDVNDDAAQLNQAHLRAIIARMFAREANVSVRLQWQPRLLAAAGALVALEKKRRERATAVLAEVNLTREVGGVTIEGRADRLERGEVTAIVDYKTGQPPTGKEVALGYAPQLPLLAWLDESAADELCYWQISGASVSEKPINEPVEQLLNDYAAFIEKRIDDFYRNRTPYYAVPVPSMQPAYNDYAHLARLKAWLDSA